jgi:hypothetical protein
MGLARIAEQPALMAPMVFIQQQIYDLWFAVGKVFLKLIRGELFCDKLPSKLVEI